MKNLVVLVLIGALLIPSDKATGVVPRGTFTTYNFCRTVALNLKPRTSGNVLQRVIKKNCWKTFRTIQKLGK